MIKKVLIQNFQRLEKCKVEFDGKITVISGPTDVGKSSLLRALRWVCLNLPQGETFVRLGADGCTVQVFVDDDRKVGRKRGKGTNTYLLDGEEFKAFGSNVPDSIASVLNMGSINFQGQHDPAFWFSLSPSEVSRQLNAIVDLGVIDDSLSSIGATVRKAKNNVDFCKARLDEAKERKESLDWVVEANREYSQVEQLESARDSVSVRVQSLKRLATDARCLILQRDRLVQQIEDINAAGRLAAKSMGVSDKRKSLSLLLKEHARLQQIRGISVPDFSGLESTIEAYNRAQRNRIRLGSAIDEAKIAKARLTSLQLASDLAHRELEKHTKGKCPVCGREMECP